MSSSRTASAPLAVSVLAYLAVAHFTNDLLTGLVPAVLPLVNAAFHVSYGALGLLVLVSNLTSSVIQPAFGAISDRKPLVWLLPLGPLLCAGGLLAIGTAASYAAVVAAVALSGLGSAAFHPEASRAARLAANAQQAGLAQAVFQVGGNLGFAVAPLLVPLVLLHTGRTGLTVSLIPALVVAAAWWAVRPRLQAAAAGAARARRRAPAVPGITSGARGALLLLSFVVAMRSFVQLGLISFLPLYYRLLPGLGTAYGEELSFAFLFAGAVGTYVGGVLSDRLGARTIIRVSLLLSAPLLLAFPYLPGRIAPAADLVILGFVVLSTFAVTVVLGQAYLPGNLALVSGLMIGLAIGMGGVGATVLGFLADRFGLTTMLRLLWLLPLTAGVASVFLPAPERARQPRVGLVRG